AGAPYVELLNDRPRLKGALSAITAAVLGVILNLAVWFALHVLFSRVETVRAGPWSFAVPARSSIDPGMVALSVASGSMLLGLRWSVHRVLALTAAVSLLWAWVGR